MRYGPSSMRTLLPLVLATVALVVVPVALVGCQADRSAQAGSSQPQATADPKGPMPGGTPMVTPTPDPQSPTMAEPPQTYNELTPFEASVILHKATERAFTGEYTDLKADGTYVCRQCNAALYRSSDKFASHCGWPSFDDEIDGAVDRVPDVDGHRTEIVCHNCGGHLGHVFLGEGFTAKDTRHCVNSVSMRFVPAGEPLPAPVVR